jgi:hypothetical protein
VVLTAERFEDRLHDYLLERAEDVRTVTAGLKEEPGLAEVTGRYSDLFTWDQLMSLREELRSSSGDDYERLFLLMKECEFGISSRDIAPLEDALETAFLGTRVNVGGDQIPLRSIQARMATDDDYLERERLGALYRASNASLNAERLRVLRASENASSAVSGIDDPLTRAEVEKNVSLAELADAASRVSGHIDELYLTLREEWFEKLLGISDERRPSSDQLPYAFRLAPIQEPFRGLGWCPRQESDLRHAV